MNLQQNVELAVSSLTNNFCTRHFNYRIRWNNAK